MNVMADPGAEALKRVRAAFSERSTLIVRRTKKSAILLATTTAVAGLFLNGMPLILFRPWGQVLIDIWVLVFASAGFDFVALIGDRSLRRKLDQI